MTTASLINDADTEHTEFTEGDEDATIPADTKPEQTPGEPVGEGDIDREDDDREVRAAGDEFVDRRPSAVGGEATPGQSREPGTPDAGDGTGTEPTTRDERDTRDQTTERCEPR